jgi:hypothetical protein
MFNRASCHRASRKAAGAVNVPVGMRKWLATRLAPLFPLVSTWREMQDDLPDFD